MCALALILAAFLGTYENFSFKRAKAVVSNTARLGFCFSALPQSQSKILHLELITEEGTGMDGLPWHRCLTDHGWFWASSPKAGIGVYGKKTVGGSSLCITGCALMPMLTVWFTCTHKPVHKITDLSVWEDTTVSVLLKETKGLSPCDSSFLWFRWCLPRWKRVGSSMQWRCWRRTSFSKMTMLSAPWLRNASSP